MQLNCNLLEYLFNQQLEAFMNLHSAKKIQSQWNCTVILGEPTKTCTTSWVGWEILQHGYCTSNAGLIRGADINRKICLKSRVGACEKSNLHYREKLRLPIALINFVVTNSNFVPENENYLEKLSQTILHKLWPVVPHPASSQNGQKGYD